MVTWFEKQCERINFEMSQRDPIRNQISLCNSFYEKIKDLGIYKTRTNYKLLIIKEDTRIIFYEGEDELAIIEFGHKHDTMILKKRWSDHKGRKQKYNVVQILDEEELANYLFFFIKVK